MRVRVVRVVLGNSRRTWFQPRVSLGQLLGVPWQQWQLVDSTLRIRAQRSAGRREREQDALLLVTGNSDTQSGNSFMHVQIMVQLASPVCLRFAGTGAGERAPGPGPGCAPRSPGIQALGCSSTPSSSSCLWGDLRGHFGDRAAGWMWRRSLWEDKRTCHARAMAQKQHRKEETDE